VDSYRLLRLEPRWVEADAMYGTRRKAGKAVQPGLATFMSNNIELLSIFADKNAYRK